jgi:hypothetical protein
LQPTEESPNKLAMAASLPPAKAIMANFLKHLPLGLRMLAHVGFHVTRNPPACFHIPNWLLLLPVSTRVAAAKVTAATPKRRCYSTGQPCCHVLTIFQGDSPPLLRGLEGLIIALQPPKAIA